MIKLAFFFSCLTLVACSDDDGRDVGNSGSGLEGDRRMVSLSAGELGSFCDYVADFGERKFTCDGETGTVGHASKEDCITVWSETKTQAPNCQATVAQTEACSEDLDSFSDAKLCQEGLPASCLSFITPECLGFE